jgi:hypothetical protein
MKKVMVAVIAMVMMSGCTLKVPEVGEHMKSPITPESDGTLVYKASEWSKQCLKDRWVKDGYWTIQSEIDCLDNSIK